MSAPATLDEIETALWQELRAAAERRDHPWRTATLITRGLDGEPDARTVVLRQVDPAERELQIFTDSRSPKARQILAHPRGTLVMWSPALGWQLRLKVALALQTDGLAVLSHWARLKMTPAQFDYLSPVPPGSPLAQPCAERGVREHFAVIQARVTEVDWLDLNRDGQRRAHFGSGPAQWLAP